MLLPCVLDWFAHDAKPEELALNFTVTEEEFGVAKSIDLIPGGSEIGVTADNRHECISNALLCSGNVLTRP
jgi:ubiquitin-protein ligase E3 C